MRRTFTSRRQLKSPAIIKVRFPVSQTFCSQIKGLSGALRGELWQISSHLDFLQCNTKTSLHVFARCPLFAPEGSPLLVPLFRFMHLAVNLRKCTPKSRKIAPVFETALNLIKNARRRQRNIPQIQ
jgi:hypothetical protein